MENNWCKLAHWNLEIHFFPGRKYWTITVFEILDSSIVMNRRVANCNSKQMQKIPIRLGAIMKGPADTKPAQFLKVTKVRRVSIESVLFIDLLLQQRIFQDPER